MENSFLASALTMRILGAIKIVRGDKFAYLRPVTTLPSFVTLSITNRQRKMAFLPKSLQFVT
jgi:hypothetical protein